MESQYHDLVCSNISPPIFFIYIGFCIASVSFLVQYLTFPKSLFTDLSNVRDGSNGYPRIMALTVRRRFPQECRRVISFFFQLDYITYAILMYILYSVLAVSVLTSVHFRLLLDPEPLLWITSVAFLILRGVIVYSGAFRKRDCHYERGHGFWTRGERRILLSIECLLWIVLLAGLYLGTVWNRGLFIFMWLIFILVLTFAWHLLMTAIAAPVTQLLRIWTGLAEDDEQEQPPGQADAEEPAPPSPEGE